MRLSPFRWIRLFFTRPLKLADLRAILKNFTRKERRSGSERRRKKSRSSGSTERRSSAGERRAAAPVAREEVDPWAKLGAPSSGLEVTEQPLDTLPADLQDELLPGAKHGSGKPPKTG